MCRYPVQFEIAGPAAIFARPDTGAAPISYPVPTWSACKAMFESVARGFFEDGKPPSAFFCPTKVEIWRPIRFEKYVTNYRGPLRKSAQIKEKSSYQLQATILVDVCFRVKGECIAIPNASNNGINAAHALQEMFERRLGNGESKYAPCLGWKEFLPSYFGSFRNVINAPDAPCHQDSIIYGIPGFLLSVWDAPVNGAYNPSFCEAIIRNGTLIFPKVSIENGKITFERGESC